VQTDSSDEISHCHLLARSYTKHILLSAFLGGVGASLLLVALGGWAGIAASLVDNIARGSLRNERRAWSGPE